MITQECRRPDKSFCRHDNSKVTRFLLVFLPRRRLLQGQGALLALNTVLRTLLRVNISWTPWYKPPLVSLLETLVCNIMNINPHRRGVTGHTLHHDSPVQCLIYWLTAARQRVVCAPEGIQHLTGIITQGNGGSEGKQSCGRDYKAVEVECRRRAT